MSWTTPTVRATGDLITASIYNADLVNNLLALGPQIAGAVSSAGALVAGSGFTSSRSGTGAYAVAFTSAFAAAPIVVATINQAATNGFVYVTSVTTSGFSHNTSGSAAVAADISFMFIAKPA